SGSATDAVSLPKSDPIPARRHPLDAKGKDPVGAQNAVAEITDSFECIIHLPAQPCIGFGDILDDTDVLVTQPEGAAGAQMDDEGDGEIGREGIEVGRLRKIDGKLRAI